MAPIAFGDGAAIADLEQYIKGSNASWLESSLKIGYLPDLDRYTKCSQLIEAKISTAEPLPPGFERPFEGPGTWTGSELTENEWLILLTKEEVEDAEAATKAYIKEYGTPNLISADTYRISPRLKTKMQSGISNLYDGRGFTIIRGLRPDDYTPLERVVTFLGLSSHIGGKLGLQTLSKSAISHLTNLRPLFPEGQIKSPGYSNFHMSYHNDTADIIALFAVGVAEDGGASMIASSAKVINELATKKPHVIRTLTENYKLNKFSSHEFNSDEYYERPLLYFCDGRPILFIARRPFTGSNPGDNPMPLPLRQTESLDAVHFAAQPHAIRVNLQKGDFQLINNFVVIHSREVFKDASTGEGGERRHLLRAFIKNPERAYKLPEQLAGAFKEIYPDIPASEFNYIIDPFGTDPATDPDTPPPQKPQPDTPPIGPTGSNG
ncbi:hypothetical protein ABW19_dt0202659 [Dactylella cylindrospora]|nr:hypothetical protein ABW19_dt0202659 [Dactylella cylindrospora]